MDAGSSMEEKKGWGSRLRDSLKSKVKEEYTHRKAVKAAYTTTKRKEEISYASERAKRDVRSKSSRAANIRSGVRGLANNLKNVSSGGGSGGNLDLDFGGGGSGGNLDLGFGGGESVSSRVDNALGSGSHESKKSTKSNRKQRRKKSKPKKPRDEGFGANVERALGGF